jgi:aldehyde dehydrogenase (NAD+)
MASTDPEAYGYDALLAGLNQEFMTLKTHDVKWRKKQLRGLLKMIQDNHETVAEAILADIPSPKMRAVLDFTFVGSLKLCLEQLDKWVKPVSVTHKNFDGSAQYLNVPKGVVLILSPFNFPFELAMGPLVTAIAAGNCAVLKPSELTPHTSALIAQLLPKYVDSSCIKVVEGGIPETTALLKLKVSEAFSVHQTSVSGMCVNN